MLTKYIERENLSHLFLLCSFLQWTFLWKLNISVVKSKIISVIIRAREKNGNFALFLRFLSDSTKWSHCLLRLLKLFSQTTQCDRTTLIQSAFYGKMFSKSRLLQVFCRLSWKLLLFQIYRSNTITQNCYSPLCLGWNSWDVAPVRIPHWSWNLNAGLWLVETKGEVKLGKVWCD